MLRIVGPDFTPELYDTFVDTNTGRTVLVMEVADSHAELDTFCTRHGARKKLDELATRHHAQVSRTPVDVHVQVPPPGLGSRCSLTSALAPTTRPLHHAQRLLQCVLALHEKGFAHLDLKTKHFLLFGGEWKLIDLDNAQAEGAEIPASATACTVRYAAPELVRARRAGEAYGVTPATDVWAMALVLCHLFTAKPLHENEELEELEEQLEKRPHEVASRLERAEGLTKPQQRLLHEMVAVHQPADDRPHPLSTAPARC